MLTYKQKHEQANREAIATVIGLAATIVVWTACGFGLSAFDITVFHTPLWVVGGTLGTFAFSIVVAVVLAKRVFKDFDLEDAPGDAMPAGAAASMGEPGTAAAGAAATAGEPNAPDAFASASAPTSAQERRHG